MKRNKKSIASLLLKTNLILILFVSVYAHDDDDGAWRAENNFLELILSRNQTQGQAYMASALFTEPAC